MADEFDHFCSGINCIFCQIAPSGKNGARGMQISPSEPSIPIGQLLEPHTKLNQIDIGRGQSDQIEQLEKFAFYDHLTGLFNIHIFLRELRQEVARANRYSRPLTIVVLRLDNYDDIKTKYGPLGCELVLKHVGKLLLNILREVDTAARLQDDQFAIILPETNETGANVVAERIRQSLAKKPAKLNSLTLEITPSVGLGTFPKHGTDMDSLLDSCFIAQSEALQNGGNRVYAL